MTSRLDEPVLEGEIWPPNSAFERTLRRPGFRRGRHGCWGSVQSLWGQDHFIILIITRKGGRNMFDEWGGTKRELSIYSILTIIVLISISGGCATNRLRIETGPRAREACLLVTEQTIKIKCGFERVPPEAGANWQSREIFPGRWTKIAWMHIDGENVPGWKEGEESDRWVELLPGHHHIFVALRSYTQTPWVDSMGYCAEGEVVVEASGVYVLNIGSNPVSQWGRWIGQVATMRTSYTYDQSTGFATHPTDSNLSFKVK